MALYAYKDKGRTQIIYATEAMKKDIGERYYCPNPFCNAHLHICAVDGSKKSYFRATKSKYGHVLNCAYGSNQEFNADKFDEKEFSFDSAVNNLFLPTGTTEKRKVSGEHKTGEVKKHPPRTIMQIYQMCKSRPVTDTYGDKEIGEMILDERSLYRYPKGCFGNRIIESYAKSKLYDNAKKQIYLFAPTNARTYTFILQFKEDSVYREFRERIYNNRNKIIVVAGNWEKSGTYGSFISDVVSKKQVAIIR